MIKPQSAVGSTVMSEGVEIWKLMGSARSESGQHQM